MGKVIAICISEKKGTVKKEVNQARVIENFGIENDAHAGNWHRQISLLSYESFIKFKDTVNIDMAYGIFGENILIQGIAFENISVGDRLNIGEVLVEVTQIGKNCHKSCEIRNIVGNCIMPTEGVFCIAKTSGDIKTGDEVHFS